jgi:hypothetical protein
LGARVHLLSISCHGPHSRRPGYIGIIAEALGVGDAVEFAAQKTRQVCQGRCVLRL